MIINILLCDDSKNDLRLLKKYIEQFFFQLPDSFDYHIDECSSGEDLLSKCKENLYHAVFLDIEMPGMNGLETARALRDSNSSILIVFVSSYDRFMRDSFEVQPFQYMEKPVSYDMTKKVCQSVIKVLSEKRSSILTISTGNGDILIDIHNLTYIQTLKGHKNSLEFHLNTGNYHVASGTVFAWENELKEYGFISSRRGVLVNINQVLGISDNQIVLKNNEILPLSRRQARIFHDTFVNHVISVLN